VSTPQPVTVTAECFPTIFRAFTHIDYANGAVNRYEPAREFYKVPAKWTVSLEECEQGLVGLMPDEFEAFCDGDYDDAAALLKSKPFLEPASVLLNGYFNGWEADE
jgi:hypothetical protein